MTGAGWWREMSDLQLRVLGPLTAYRDGVEVALGGRRQRMVLATLLVARGRMLPEERLRDLVWSDGGRLAGRATLHGYVAGLRRALEPDRPMRSRAGFCSGKDPGTRSGYRPNRSTRNGSPSWSPMVGPCWTGDDRRRPSGC